MANGDADWRMVRNIMIGAATMVLAGYIAWSAQCNIDAGNRLTKLETKFDYVATQLQKIDVIEQMVQEIRHDQKRREAKEKR